MRSWRSPSEGEVIRHRHNHSTTANDSPSDVIKRHHSNHPDVHPWFMVKHQSSDYLTTDLTNTTTHKRSTLRSPHNHHNTVILNDPPQRSKTDPPTNTDTLSPIKYGPIVGQQISIINFRLHPNDRVNTLRSNRATSIAQNDANHPN